MLEGFATAEGTAAYAARHRAIPYRVGGKLGLTLSAAGFGCYRVDAAITEHQAPIMLMGDRSGLSVRFWGNWQPKGKYGGKKSS